jgi:regulatory protein
MSDQELRIVDLQQDGATARVRLSDGETMELAVESLPPALPAPGEPLSPETLHELRAGAERKVIAKRVFNMLDRRLQTRRDMERKLVERGYDPEQVDAVLDRFEAAGVHSDRNYAEAWCRDTIRARAVGRRYLVSKMCGKGIARGLAEAVVEAELSDEVEESLAHAAAETWCRKNPGGDEMRRRSRAQRFMNGRGFSHTLIRRAVDAAINDERP